jgi:hypothetical protein
MTLLNTNNNPPSPHALVSSRATYSGTLETTTPVDVVRRFAALTTPSIIEFQPGGLRLHLERGKIVGVLGGEPLGQILLAQGIITEVTLSEALRLQGARPLGITLTDAPFRVPQDTVRRALERQIYGVLDKIALEPLSSYAFFRANQAAPLHPRVAVDALAKRDATRHGLDEFGLPLFETWRMGMISDDATLTPDEWALCRLLNGRRTLQQAIERFGALENGTVRARVAAQSLLRRGLLEPSAVAGLRTIVVARKRDIGASYHPPAGMIANLFLRQLDGVSDAYSIALALKVDSDRAAAVLAGLYRDNVVDVITGHLELSRLLEDY